MKDFHKELRKIIGMFNRKLSYESSYNIPSKKPGKGFLRSFTWWETRDGRIDFQMLYSNFGIINQPHEDTAALAEEVA